MTKTFGAFALAVALIAGAGAGAASAMPTTDGGFTYESVFEPQN